MKDKILIKHQINVLKKEQIFYSGTIPDDDQIGRMAWVEKELNRLRKRYNRY